MLGGLTQTRERGGAGRFVEIVNINTDYYLFVAIAFVATSAHMIHIESNVSGWIFCFGAVVAVFAMVFAYNRQN